MSGEFIEILSPKALADLEKLNAGLLETIASVDKIGQKMKTVVTPSGADSAVKQLNDAYIRQQKQLAELQIKLERYTQAQTRTKITANQLEQSEMRLANARDKQAQALAREQAKLEASQNLYNKVQTKLNALSNEYKALAVRKELGLTLTQKEEQRYASLQGRIQNYDKALKAVDASMGKYQRNVGNYASAFNPLGNSINQLTREMPAFANSVQTGFMAISNNLPIFFDSMQEVIRQNKELQAQGQPTKSVLSQLAGAFFSWGTALSVGVTLLTVYGKEIVNFISGSERKKQAIEAEKKAIEERTRVEENLRQVYAQNQANEIAKSKLLLETAKNVSLSYKQRSEAVKELQQRYPEYLGNLSKEQILAGDTAKAEEELNEALLKRGVALASQQLIQSEIENQLKNRKKLSDEVRQIERERIELANELAKYDPFAEYNEETMEKIDMLKWKLGQLIQQEKNRRFDSELNNAVIQDSINFYIKQYNENAKYLDVVKETTDATRNGNKEKRQELETVEMTSKAYDSLLGRLEDAKTQLELIQSSTSRNTEEWAFYEEKILEVNTAIDILKNGFKSLHESSKTAIDDFLKQQEEAEKQRQALKALEQQMIDYAFSFTQSFGQNSGFPTLFKVLNKEILGFGENWAVTFNTIGEIAQETFSFISQLSQQRFQAEYESLAQEKQIALAFAGESASAREEIERQYEARRRQIKQREFKARQQEALFNIAIDTAQAIVGLWAKPGFPQAIPLMATVAGIGLAQAAFVASQQIPQFWRGTDNAPEGWAWTQEKGREIITDASGRVKSTGSDKGATLTYLNRGDKVYTAQESAMMFDRNLNNLLAYNGIQMPTVKVDSTLTEAQVNRIVSAVQNKESVNMNIDRNGLNVYVRNGHTTKQNINSRIRGIGRNV